MKYETSIEGMKVEIYTDPFEKPGETTNVQVLLSAPGGRWVQPVLVSTMFMEGMEDEFIQHMAESVLYSYNKREI